MHPNENAGKQFHPVKPFLPTDLADFDIQWGTPEEWLGRNEKARGTTAHEPLLILSLYWKYAWNTARCPWLMPNFVEQVTKQPNMAERFWNAMLQNSESQLTIIGTQVMAYSGLYFAYENFVTNCYSAKSGNISNSLFRYADIRNALIQAFGASVESEVWSCDEIERIRRVRNDLAHNGGCPGERTKELAPDMIIEGHIAVTPNDIKEAFTELKLKVDILLDQRFPALAEE